MRIITDNNEILDSNVSIEQVEDKTGITFAARGGTTNSTNSRNVDYSLGVEVVLRRLKREGVQFLNAFIDSSESRTLSPRLRDRQLIVEGNTDIPLQNYQPESLRKLISRELVHRKADPDTTGGNPNKRLFITAPTQDVNWIKIIRPNEQLLTEDLLQPVHVDAFDPNSVGDAKEKVLVSINRRRGQPKFRNDLLRLYNNRCAITETAVVQVLQAAHIFPYLGESTNHLSNGIILRADIHDLFDLDLISINEEYSVIVSPLLKDTEYEKYHNQQIRLPNQIEYYPSKNALRLRPKAYRPLD